VGFPQQFRQVLVEQKDVATVQIRAFVLVYNFNRTANAFGMELAIQSVNQLAQTTEVTVSKKVNLALLAGSDLALDTKKLVLDGVWRIVSPIYLAYLSAKFAQPTGKALVVVSQQDILGYLVP